MTWCHLHHARVMKLACLWVQAESTLSMLHPQPGSPMAVAAAVWTAAARSCLALAPSAGPACVMWALQTHWYCVERVPRESEY